MTTKFDFKKLETSLYFDILNRLGVDYFWITVTDWRSDVETDRQIEWLLQQLALNTHYRCVFCNCRDIGCVLGCPYEGHIAPEAVAKVSVFADVLLIYNFIW